MKTRPWKPYVLWILGTEAVGGLSGWLTRDGAAIYKATIAKPPLSPPSIAFPIVWTVLFALMGVGAARISLAPASQVRCRSLLLFWLQLVFNFF
jgi:benzodiazapine receptor